MRGNPKPLPARRGLKWLRWITFSCVALILFYAMEDWRGLKAWRAAQTQLAKDHQPTNFAALVPRTVPDAQNFYKVPLVQRLHLGNSNERKDPETVLEAKEFDELYEAIQRPYARLDGDFATMASVPVCNLGAFQTVAKRLALEARQDFLHGRTNQGIQDFAILKGLLLPLDAHPRFLDVAIFRTSVGSLYADTFKNVLMEKGIKEAELAELQAQLENMNVLLGVGETIHLYERLYACELLDGLARLPWFASDRQLLELFPPGQLPGLGLRLAPAGWVRQNQASVVQDLLRIADCYDPGKRRFDLKELAELERELTNRRATPYTFLSLRIARNCLAALKSAAYRQTRIDQALIVCALERYRLKHHQYPVELEEISPRVLAIRPRDVFGGREFVYRRKSPNDFLLYAVGSNGVDDGGQPCDTKHPETGDWVW